MNKTIRVVLMFAGYVSMSLQDNLRFLLARENLNANSLQEKSEGKLPQPTTRRILNGETESVREATLKKYADFFHVNLQDLQFGDLAKVVTVTHTEPSIVLGDLQLWDEETPVDTDEIEIPYFKEVMFAAGNGATQVVEEQGRKLRFSKRTLKDVGVDPKDAACATNCGKSMERLIMDGAALGIDKSKQTIKDGKIYAFDHGGLLRVKYLYRQPFGGLKLVSENKEYPDEYLTPEQVQTEFRLLGWVFWWSTLDRW